MGLGHSIWAENHMASCSRKKEIMKAVTINGDLQSLKSRVWFFLFIFFNLTQKIIREWYESSGGPFSSEISLEISSENRRCTHEYQSCQWHCRSNCTRNYSEITLKLRHNYSEMCPSRLSYNMTVSHEYNISFTTGACRDKLKGKLWKS